MVNNGQVILIRTIVRQNEREKKKERSRKTDSHRVTLGREASSVFPAFVGALQEAHSKKQAREMDAEVVSKVSKIKFKGLKEDPDHPETAPDAQTVALKALGQGRK